MLYSCHFDKTELKIMIFIHFQVYHRNEKNFESSYGPGGGGTPLYKLYRYLPPQRVWFLSRFGLKTGIDFDH